MVAPNHLICSVLSYLSSINAHTEVKSQPQVPQTSEGGQDAETASSKWRRPPELGSSAFGSLCPEEVCF